MTTPPTENPTPTPTPTPTPDQQHATAALALAQWVLNPAKAEREEQEAAKQHYLADTSHYERQSDTGNAEELAARYRDRLRYVPAWGWLAYDGSVWRRDSGEMLAERAAKDTLRHLLKQTADIESDYERQAELRHLQRSFNRIGPMVETAKSCPQLAADVADFDREPLLLNLRNGVYNLAADQLMPHSPTFLLTKQASVAYDPDATAPTWERVVGDIFNHDTDLIGYFQRAAGFTLTADVREDAFFVCFGTGANGKSTLLNAIMGVLGDYAVPLKAEVLMTQAPGNSGSASPELAKLVGARFVPAQEPPRGDLNTSRMKELTGRDPMQVRELYREPFTMLPTFKLWMSTNERPNVPEQTVGVWRRIRLIPFTRSFADHPDTTLPAQLQDEASGILNWMLEGYRQWQRDGLGTAKEVSKATREYREQNDPQLEFFTDWLVPAAEGNAKLPVADAYQAYQRWHDEAKKRVGPFEFLGEKVFGKAAEQHGYARVKGTGGTRCLAGCRLATEAERGEALLAREAEAEGPVAKVAILEPVSQTFPNGVSRGKVYGERPNIATTATPDPAPDPDPSTLSRADLIAAVAGQLAPAARCAPTLAPHPTTCRHACVQEPTSDRATWQCWDCGREWPADACPMLTETYWHTQFTLPTDPDHDHDPNGESAGGCRHLRAYPPKQPDYDPGDPPVWKCPDCGNYQRCAHPAEHHPTAWRHGGCIACAIEHMRRTLACPHPHLVTVQTFHGPVTKCADCGARLTEDGRLVA